MTDERDQQIEALATMIYDWTASPFYDRAATALLDGPVAVMLAEAKRQGAVEALRAMTQRTFTTANGRYGVDAALSAFAADIEQGGPIGGRG